jgi:hypothetical protein
MTPMRARPIPPTQSINTMRLLSEDVAAPVPNQRSSPSMESAVVGVARGRGVGVGGIKKGVSVGVAVRTI